MKILPKGTELMCPQCHRIMARLKKDIQSGEILKTEYFESVDGQIKQYTSMRCPWDGVDYGRSKHQGAFEVHTKDGWK